MTTVTDASGYYQFNNLAPANYSVGFTPPAGYIFTTQDATGSTDANDSDVNPSTGRTITTTIVAGENDPTWDAGIYLQPTIKSSLGNRVWKDLNKNGIQDPNETGVAGVTVTLYAANGTTVIATTTTDAFGNYIFNNLDAGSYVVGFSNLPAGFQLTGNDAGGVNDATDSDANPSTGKTVIINLGAGKNDLTWDAGIYQTSDANTAGLGNFVWNDTDKDGLQDPNEQGVAGVTALLYNSAGVVIASTTTDATGYYQFTNLPAGTYSVGFFNLPKDYIFTSADAAGSTDANDSDANPTTGRTPTVTLAAGEFNPSLDAGIVRPTINSGLGSIGNYVWNDTNNNGIQDPTEIGVSNVLVTLYDVNGNALGTTVTNAQGNYIFNGLPAGQYQVGFSNLPADYVASPQNQGTNDANDSDVTAATGRTQIISLATGENNTTLDLGIHNANALAGLGNYVWNDANSNGIQDAGELGVGGVSVTLYNSAGAVIANTTTSANGYYEFRGLTPGVEYVVGFDNLPAGYSFTSPNQGTNDANDSDANGSGRTGSYILAANEFNSSVDAGIVSSTAQLGDFVWFDADSDGIQDANETGLAGVLVTLFDSNGNPVATAITDDNGKYLFPNLAPGTYTVGFSNLPGGTAFSPSTQGNNTGSDSNVNPTTGRTAPIVLVSGSNNLSVDAGIMPKPSAGLGDYVWFDSDRDGVQDPGEAPMAGVTVMLYDATGTTVIAMAVTDSRGRYSFTDLPAGSYRVRFGNLPSGFKFTASNSTSGNDLNDSDADVNSGFTGVYTLAIGEYNPSVDGGIQTDPTLPVEYVSINVSVTNVKEVLIKWVTATETNSDYFEIQRVQNIGETPELVTIVRGKGTFSGISAYQKIDKMPLQGKSYYRLVQYDFDGRTSESRWFEVNLDKKAIQFDASVYPNPTTRSQDLNLQISSTADNVSVSIENELGQTVYTKFQCFEADGTVQLVVPTNNLEEGIYFIKIRNSEQNVVRKIVIQK